MSHRVFLKYWRYRLSLSAKNDLGRVINQTNLTELQNTSGIQSMQCKPCLASDLEHLVSKNV